MSTQLASEAAERALGQLAEMSADLRSCALLDSEGAVIAASADIDWSAGVAELLAAVEGDPGVTQIHVASEAGELFALRSGRYTVVALSDRFALASLMFCDLRAVLRELGEASSGASEQV